MCLANQMREGGAARHARPSTQPGSNGQARSAVRPGLVAALFVLYFGQGAILDISDIIIIASDIEKRSR